LSTKKTTFVIFLLDRCAAKFASLALTNSTSRGTGPRGCPYLCLTWVVSYPSVPIRIQQCLILRTAFLEPPILRKLPLTRTMVKTL